MLDKTIKIPKLIGSSNYELWAIRIKAVLTTKEPFSFQTRAVLDLGYLLLDLGYL